MSIADSGNRTFCVVHPDKRKKLKTWHRYSKKHLLTGNQLSNKGTASWISIMQRNKQLSTKNYFAGQFNGYDMASCKYLEEAYNLVNCGT
ncbi:MAG: hypothetical protein HUJ51_02200 [Eggerthellaceae bacterium]|nr:hypothetical protein [Eggerthellaceae bacterium]